MRRVAVAVAAIAIALSLVGCPLPQPLPTYPAGTVTPPRILSATTSSGVNSIVPVPARCATPPSYTLDAWIFYQDSVAVEARWFVDYRTDDSNRNVPRNVLREVTPDPDALVLKRQVPSFVFVPYDYPSPAELGGSSTPRSDPGVVHVVELVVSNGFDTSPTAPQPNRSPGITPDGASQFEIQTYRWTLVNVPEDPAANCDPGSLGCPRCPLPL
jgi:hypothetical protein